MLECDLGAEHFYGNQTSPVNFAEYFPSTFSKEHVWRAASAIILFHVLIYFQVDNNKVKSFYAVMKKIIFATFRLS